MLSRHELETIRAEAESDALDQHAAETILALLWHIDALDAQDVPSRYQANRKAAQDAYDSVGEARRRKLMQTAIDKRKGA